MVLTSSTTLLNFLPSYEEIYMDNLITQTNLRVTMQAQGPCVGM